MNEVIEKEFALDLQIANNKEKIDEALISLRLMRLVDDYLASKNISQRDFAQLLGYTESYISQLMTGNKKVNTSFIQRLEHTFDIKIGFTLSDV